MFVFDNYNAGDGYLLQIGRFGLVSLFERRFNEFKKKIDHTQTSMKAIKKSGELIETGHQNCAGIIKSTENLIILDFKEDFTPYERSTIRDWTNRANEQITKLERTKRLNNCVASAMESLEEII